MSSGRNDDCIHRFDWVSFLEKRVYMFSTVLVGSERFFAKRLKSSFFSFRFLPFSVSAISSLSSGIGIFVHRRSYAGDKIMPFCGVVNNEKFLRCISALPVRKENKVNSNKRMASK